MTGAAALGAVGDTLRVPALFIRRDLAGISRGWLLFVLRGSVAGLSSLVAGLLLWQTVRTTRATELGLIGGWLFHAILVIQALLVCAFAPLRGLAAICLERTRGTWGLLAMTRIGGMRAVFGKLCSVLALQAALVMLVAPIQALGLLFGGVSGRDMLYAAWFLVDLSFLGATLGLAAGSFGSRAIVSLGRLGGLAALLYVVVPFGLATGSEGQSPVLTEATVTWLITTFHPMGVFATLLGAPISGAAALNAALSWGLPLPGVLFLAVALLAARGVGSEGSGRRSLWQRIRARLGIGGWIAFAFGIPTFSVAIAVAVKARLEQLWGFWFGFEMVLVYFAAPMIAAIPLAKERETGAIQVLMTTPLRGSRIYLGRGARRVGIFLGVSVLLLQAHWLAIALLDPRLPAYGRDEAFRVTLPVEAALAALFLSSLALLVSAVSRGVFSSVALSAVVTLGVTIGPFLCMPLFYIVYSLTGTTPRWVENVVPFFSPMSFFAPLKEGGPTAPIFGALGAATVAFGSILFDRLQRRFPVAV
ncbi:MAG: hypothetical protein U0166_08030 [Acidobacteriota bacterium]